MFALNTQVNSGSEVGNHQTTECRRSLSISQQLVKEYLLLNKDSNRYFNVLRSAVSNLALTAVDNTDEEKKV